MNNKKWTWLAVAMLAALAPAVAFAGYKSAVLVSCTGNAAGGSCSGNLLSANYSSDLFQEIWCETSVPRAGANRDVVCWARPLGAPVRTCTSSAAPMADVAASVSFESYVEFKWAADGSCTYIRVRNTSSAAPF